MNNENNNIGINNDNQGTINNPNIVPNNTNNNSSNVYNNDINTVNQNQPSQVEINNVENKIEPEQVLNNVSSEQVIMEQTPSINNSSIDKPKKKVSIVIIIGLILLIGIIVTLVIFLLPKGGSSSSSSNSVFFFYGEKEKKYAMFNEDGKNITGFEFTNAYKFIDDTALVKKGDKEGIINTKGKMIVPFENEYYDIYHIGNTYAVTTSDYKKYILDSNLKQLYDLSDKEINYDVFTDDMDYYIITDNNSKKYIVIGSDGKEIINIPIDKENRENPKYQNSEKVAIIYYNNKNYVIDLINYKEITSFESKKEYCVVDNNSDASIVIMSECESGYLSDYSDASSYIYDGKVYDVSDKCDDLELENGDIVACVKGYRKYMIDSNGNADVEMSEIAYFDRDSYAKKESGLSVNFYIDNKVVNTVQCRDLSLSKDTDMYVLYTRYSSKCKTNKGDYELYNKKGEKIVDKVFKYVYMYEKVTIVSEDEKKYYLVDSNGKELSEKYDSITFDKNGYFIVKNDNKYGLLDYNGKKILDTNYLSVDIDVYDVGRTTVTIRNLLP